MTRPWMPLYVSDYLGDTRSLSTLEHGAYLLLLMEYWQVGGLPAEEERLARIAGLSMEEWRKVRGALTRFFDADWKNKRIEEELQKAKSISASRRQAARKRHGDAGNDASAPANAGANAHTSARVSTSTSTSTNPPVDANASTAPPGADDDGPEPSSAPAVQEAAGESASGKEPKAKTTAERGKRLSEDWTPQPGEVEFAREHGFSDQEIEDAAAEFRDYWLAIPGQRGRKVDWDRTFRNRIRDIAGRRQRTAYGSPPGGGGSRSGGVVASAGRVLSQIGRH